MLNAKRAQFFDVLRLVLALLFNLSTLQIRDPRVMSPLYERTAARGGYVFDFVARLNLRALAHVRN